MIIKKEKNFFYTCNNSVLKSTQEMLDWIKNTDDKSFYYHINSERNDFAGWVKKILRDSVLSKKLEKLKNREEIIEAIKQRQESKNKKNKKSLISQIKDAISNG